MNLTLEAAAAGHDVHLRNKNQYERAEKDESLRNALSDLSDQCDDWFNLFNKK